MRPTETPKKTGRPKKPEEETRNERVQIRITQNERDLLNRLSEREGCTNTDAIIKALRFYDESTSGKGCLSVPYVITQEQAAKLETLAADYSKALSEITTAGLFQMMMLTGSAHEIDQRIETFSALLKNTAKKRP